MKTNQNEKRRFKRIYFKPSDWMVAYFEIPSQPINFHANIMNISITGMALHITTDANFSLQTGDTISLVKISGGLPINFAGSVNAAIRWIVNEPFFKYRSAGCEFIAPPLELTDLLGKLIYNKDE